jgi:hypothetical protein
MNESSMMVVIHPGSCFAITAPSITYMISLTEILLVSVVFNLILVF